MSTLEIHVMMTTLLVNDNIGDGVLLTIPDSREGRGREWEVPPRKNAVLRIKYFQNYATYIWEHSLGNVHLIHVKIHFNNWLYNKEKCHCLVHL